ncbi:MAG: hypothetical protein BGO12_22775 [Verrucomicrobia bacterium 61-8]|nr:ROK family protein [Verrucomicrobiota bacterium]OJV19928.1 MAG: hypothetical protein BGO12_22775 [Verrucomicrobia bacterium 61-8]
MKDGLLLGIDIGGTKTAVIQGTATGEVLDRHEWPSRAERGPHAMLAEIVAAARKFSYSAVGVSIGGPLNSPEGIIYSPPNLPGWDAFPLKAFLQRELDTPVNVEHDAAACAYAEYLWGAGRNAHNLAYLTCGTGFGSGFVFGGKIHRGARGGSCEAGHIGLRPDGPIAFGKRGSAESYCSGTALGLLAAWKFPDRWPHPPQGRELSDLAASGDADALNIILINASAVGEIAAILADAVGLDCILLGSLAFYLGAPWLDEVRRSFEAHALPPIANGCRIEPAGLGKRLQDCSALAAALCEIRWGTLEDKLCLSEDAQNNVP